MPMRIYIGSDHAGFELKAEIINWLHQQGHEVKDLGPDTLIPDDDYPDYAKKVADSVSQDLSSRGILICRNGVGVCIAANKVKGIRAVSTENPLIAKASRNDDDTNILCLGSDYLDFRQAGGIIEIWLAAGFSGEERHKRRIDKIVEMEK